MFYMTSELESAFDNLFKAVESTIQSVQVVAQSVTPVVTFLQVSESTLETLKATDPKNILMNSVNPQALKKPFEDLSEIQVAATRSALENQSKMANALSKDAVEIVKPESTFTSPQNSLAEFINDSVALYNDFNGSISDQTSSFNSISSAYKAWMQNTLFELSQPLNAS